VFLSKRTEVDFLAWREARDWTARKYAMWERGELMTRPAVRYSTATASSTTWFTCPISQPPKHDGGFGIMRALNRHVERAFNP
jgi:hypothetical protein